MPCAVAPLIGGCSEEKTHLVVSSRYSRERLHNASSDVTQRGKINAERTVLGNAAIGISIAGACLAWITVLDSIENGRPIKNGCRASWKICLPIGCTHVARLLETGVEQKVLGH